MDITPWGRPVVALSLALNYAWGGLNVTGYHLVNILIHFFNGYLLASLSIRLLRVQRWNKECAASAAPLGFVIALIWLLHPLGTSTATYIVQRAESMMAFFYLATLETSTRFLSSPKQRGWAFLSVLTCSWGMLTKESMITAPVAVLLTGIVFYPESFLLTLRRNWAWALGLVFSWLVLWAVMAAWPRTASVGFGIHGMTSGEYLLIQIRVVLHYLGLVFWPLDLSLNYPQRFWPTMESVPDNTWPLIHSVGEVWPEGVVLTAILALTAWLFWKRPALGYLPMLFFLILSPTSSVVPIVTSLAADHRAYLPSAAIIALVIIAAFLFTGQTPKAEIKLMTSLRVTSVCLLSVILLLLTLSRNRDYQDGLTVWIKSLQKNPRDAAGWNELGGVYWMRSDHFRALGDLPASQQSMVAAQNAFLEGSKVCNTYLLPLSNLAVTRWNLGFRQEAITLLEAVLDREPTNTHALANLALYQEQLGQTTEATKNYSRLLQRFPHDPGALEGLRRLGHSSELK